MANKEKMRRYSAWAASSLCILSFLVIILGVNYRAAIIIHAINFIIAALNFDVLRFAAKKYGHENAIDRSSEYLSSTRGSSFRPLIDLFTLSAIVNFPIYIWITYIIHTIYSFLTRNILLINIIFIVMYFVLIATAHLSKRQD